MLPDGMLGTGVAEKAREMYPDLGVVFTSGYPDDKISDLKLNGAPPGFIRKPYIISELTALLQDVLIK